MHSRFVSLIIIVVIMINKICDEINFNVQEALKIMLITKTT